VDSKARRRVKKSRAKEKTLVAPHKNRNRI